MVTVVEGLAFALLLGLDVYSYAKYEESRRQLEQAQRDLHGDRITEIHSRVHNTHEMVSKMSPSQQTREYPEPAAAKAEAVALAVPSSVEQPAAAMAEAKWMPDAGAWGQKIEQLSTESEIQETRITQLERDIQEIKNSSHNIEATLSNLEKALERQSGEVPADTAGSERLSELEYKVEEARGEVERMRESIEAISDSSRKGGDWQGLEDKIEEARSAGEKASAEISEHINDAQKMQEGLDERLSSIEEKLAKLVEKSGKQKDDKGRKLLRQMSERLLKVEEEMSLTRGEFEVGQRAVSEKIEDVKEKAAKKVDEKKLAQEFRKVALKSVTKVDEKRIVEEARKAAVKAVKPAEMDEKKIMEAARKAAQKTATKVVRKKTGKIEKEAKEMEMELALQKGESHVAQRAIQEKIEDVREEAGKVKQAEKKQVIDEAKKQARKTASKLVKTRAGKLAKAAKSKAGKVRKTRSRKISKPKTKSRKASKARTSRRVVSIKKTKVTRTSLRTVEKRQAKPGKTVVTVETTAPTEVVEVKKQA